MTERIKYLKINNKVNNKNSAFLAFKAFYMITEKKQSPDELPEPIDLKMDIPPEENKKDKKSKGKDEVNASQKKDSLEELVEKNIKWSKAIYSQNKKIKKRLNIMIFGGYLKLFIILAPIILALIYLPSLIEQYMPQVRNIFDASSGGNLINSILEGYGLNDVLSNPNPEQLQQMQNSLKTLPK